MTWDDDWAVVVDGARTAAAAIARCDTGVSDSPIELANTAETRLYEVWYAQTDDDEHRHRGLLAPALRLIDDAVAVWNRRAQDVARDRDIEARRVDAIAVCLRATAVFA